MTVITWANFPEIKDSVRGQDTAIVVSEMFLPPTYADVSARLGQFTRILGKITILTCGIILIGEIEVFASTGLDEKAKVAYAKFIEIAKWIVAGRGGWETINKMLKEDFDGAKKSFFSYLTIFAILIGLPRALDFIESFLSDI